MAEVAQLRSETTTLLKANSSPQEAQPSFGMLFTKDREPTSIDCHWRFKANLSLVSLLLHLLQWQAAHGATSLLQTTTIVTVTLSVVCVLTMLRHLVANNPAYHAMDDAEVVEAIMELTDCTLR